jgi:hypothetical protein
MFQNQKKNSWRRTELSEYIRGALGTKDMKSVAKKFLTHREISAQKGIYRLLSLPLVQGSRQILFIPTDLPELRTHLFKPMKVIETLEDDDLDLFMVSFSFQFIN